MSYSGDGVNSNMLPGIELEPERKRWSLLKAALSFLLLLGLALGITTSLVLILEDTGAQLDPSLGFLFSSGSFLLAAFGYLLLTGQIKRSWSVLKLTKFKWKYVLVGFGSAIGAYMVAIIVGMIAVFISGPDLVSGGDGSGGGVGQNNTTEVIGGLAQSQSLLLLGFLIAILAPLAEEIFFRGALLGALVQESKSKWVKIASLILVSIVFAMFHYQGATGTIADALAVVTPGIVGLTAGALALGYKSLYPAIFTHIFYNAGVALIIFGSTGALA